MKPTEKFGTRDTSNRCMASMGYIWPCSVQCHFGAIRCTRFFKWPIIRMRLVPSAVLTEIWSSGLSFSCLYMSCSVSFGGHLNIHVGTMEHLQNVFDCHTYYCRQADQQGQWSSYFKVKKYIIWNDLSQRSVRCTIPKFHWSFVRGQKYPQTHVLTTRWPIQWSISLHN